MIVTKKDSFVSGNNVLVPERKISRQFKEEQERKNKDLKHKQIKNEKRKKLKSEFKVLLNISIAFVLGIVIIYRYSTLYVVQKKLNNLKSEISVKQKQNEKVRLQLVGFKNQKYIEKEALGRLKMIKPDKNSIEYIDLSKNNFKPKNIKQDQNGINILEKIKKIFS